MLLGVSKKDLLVYSTTPMGSRKQAAAVGTPVKLVTTADPPVSNMEVTKISAGER